MIILATISINFVFNGGLIDRAEQARDYYQNDEAYTGEKINEVTGYIDGLINGIEGGSGGSGAGEGTTTEDGVPIPAGFYYVGGTKEEGVVISDDSADEGKGTSHAVAQTLVGNQFVWIPVEDDSAFERYLGYYDGELDTHFPLENYSEPYAGGYTNEQSEFEAMKASVLANNGFYVGRYEAGTSTLIYGVQWDAIMNFIDPAYAEGSCAEDSFVRDSSGHGWYGQSVPTVTGPNENYAVKNIYDLGGNVEEWTMEAYDTDCRVYRGGIYNVSGLVYPASHRYF